jgi:hypothetical protein
MLKPYQIQQLEGLYRQAVQLGVNPAGGPAPCECGCGRIGCNAHHVVFRGQEPGIRWKYEPIWGLWVAAPCHTEAHTKAEEFVERILARLHLVNKPKAMTLRLYIENHDRLQCPNVAFSWMREYMKRRIIILQKSWMNAYSCDV